MTVDDSGQGPQHFDIGVEWQDTVVILTVSGELDLSTVPALAESIDLVVGKSPSAVIVDLSGVGFLASAGMAQLATAHQQIGETATLAVVADGPATGRPLALVGLDEVFRIYATTGEALSAIRTGSS